MANVAHNGLSEPFGRLLSCPEHHEDLYIFTLDGVGQPDGRGLCNRRMAHQCVFHICRAYPVTCNVEYIIRTAQDGKIAVLVAYGHISCKVTAGYDVPHLLIPFGITVDGLHHVGQGLPEYQVAPLAGFNRIALFIHHICHNSGHGFSAPARLVGHGRHGPEYGRSYFSLPEIIYAVAVVLKDYLLGKMPGLWVQGFTGTCNDSQGGAVVFFNVFLAEPHEHAKGSRGGEHGGDTVFLHLFPDHPGMRVIRSPFSHEYCGPCHQGTVDNIRMSDYPAYVRRGPVDILVLNVKKCLGQIIGTHHEPPVHMHHSLGFPRGAGRVEYEKRVLRVHDLRGAAVALGIQELPVIVFPFIQLYLGFLAPKYYHAVHIVQIMEGIINHCLEADHLAPPVTHVCTYDSLGPGILNP